MIWRLVSLTIDVVFWTILLIVVTGGLDLQYTIAGQAVRIDATRPDLFVLLLLILLAIWQRSDRPWPELRSVRILSAAYDRLRSHGARILTAAIALAAIVYLVVPQVRHRSFQTGIDLALFAQAYWNTLQGDFLFSSIRGIALWGEHFNPIVLAVLPFYRVWPGPETLLALQSLALVAGAIPLYALARLELRDRALATVLSLAYLLYLPIRLTNLFDFHPIAFATPLIFAAFYFLRRKRYGWFLVFCVLVGATKETGPIAVALLGASCLFLSRRRLLGGTVLVGAAVWFVLNLLVVMPAFDPAGVQTQLDRYGYLGDSFGEIARTLFTRPFYVLAENSTSRELFYPIRILAPVAFLPLLTPTGLLALPYLLINILEGSRIQVWLVHYQAELTAFIFIAAIFGAKRWLGSRSPRSLAAALMTGSLLFFGQSEIYRLREAWPTEDTRRIHHAIERLPADACVSAQAPLAPHLAQRKHLLVFPEVSEAEWVVVDYGLDPWPVSPERFNRTVKRLRRAGFQKRYDDSRTRIYQAARP